MQRHCYTTVNLLYINLAPAPWVVPPGGWSVHYRKDYFTFLVNKGRKRKSKDFETQGGTHYHLNIPNDFFFPHFSSFELLKYEVFLVFVCFSSFGLCDISRRPGAGKHLLVCRFESSQWVSETVRSVNHVVILHPAPLPPPSCAGVRPWHRPRLTGSRCLLCHPAAPSLPVCRGCCLHLSLPGSCGHSAYGEQFKISAPLTFIF